MYRLLLAVGLALVGGCATPLEVASITDVRSNTGSRGIDVHEPKRQAGHSSVPEFAGDQLVEVRTYKSTADQGEVEIAGATCTLSAADFSATMQSPAKVRVPLYRAQSSALAVACEMPGFQRRLVTLEAYDSTRQSRLASSGNGGLIGVIAVAAVDAMADNTKNDWRYPIARVVLEPGTSAAETSAKDAPAAPPAKSASSKASPAKAAAKR
jgi:hypothetical protein